MRHKGLSLGRMLLPLLLLSCTADDERYTTEYTCAFSFDTKTHITSMLTRALGNPGMFVAVDVTKEKGIFKLSMQQNNGTDSETVYLTTEEENRRIGNVGASNSLIIGCTNFNGLAAFDRQCPNCLSNHTTRNFPLTWADNGQAVTCATCKRVYQLNYSGSANEGKRLIEYRVRYDGTLLVVN